MRLMDDFKLCFCQKYRQREQFSSSLFFTSLCSKKKGKKTPKNFLKIMICSDRNISKEPLEVLQGVYIYISGDISPKRETLSALLLMVVVV